MFCLVKEVTKKSDFLINQGCLFFTSGGHFYSRLKPKWIKEQLYLRPDVLAWFQVQSRFYTAVSHLQLTLARWNCWKPGFLRFLILYFFPICCYFFIMTEMLCFKHFISFFLIFFKLLFFL